MSNSEHEDSDVEIPQEILDEAQSAIDDCLPTKSKAVYEKVYEDFNKWKKDKKVRVTNEQVVLAYMKILSKTLAPSTLWSKRSMLKTMIEKEEGIDIDKYKQVNRFLKEKNKGFRSKKAPTFTSKQIATYLYEAPDDEHLDTKVGLILGVTGACRRQELKDICLEHIKIEGDHLTITLPKTKTRIVRTFCVNNPLKDIIVTYMNLRPENVKESNLFLNYHDGKCSKQVIGINKIGAMPHKIAKYLKLENAKSYTGHSFRRTSATLLAHAGASLAELKRHGGWASETTVDGYVADASPVKRKICDRITESFLNEESCDSASSNLFKKVKISHDQASSSTVDQPPTSNDDQNQASTSNLTSATSNNAAMQPSTSNNNQFGPTGSCNAPSTSDTGVVQPSTSNGNQAQAPTNNNSSILNIAVATSGENGAHNSKNISSVNVEVTNGRELCSIQ